MRIMQLVWRQTSDDVKSLCIFSKTVNGKSVRYCAVDVVRCAIIRFFGELMCTFYVLFKVESQPREVSCNGRIDGRNLMKPFENFVQLSAFAPGTINPAKIVKS